jgi:hypothetical protein
MFVGAGGVTELLCTGGGPRWPVGAGGGACCCTRTGGGPR